MSYRVGARSVVVVAFNNQVFGLDAASGARLWVAKGDGASQWPRILVHGDRVLAAGLETRVLTCLALESGVVVWRCPTRVSGSTILIDEGRIFLGGNGELECVSLDGKALWFDGFKGLGLGPVAIAVPGQAVQPDT